MKYVLSADNKAVARTESATVVLDLASGGRLVGIEVLQLSRTFGAQGITRADSSGLRIDVDGVADAMYIRLGEGPSSAQEICEAVFALDDEHRPISVDLDWSGPGA